MKILIIGVTCSGKSSLLQKFMDKGLENLKEYTDRPMRNVEEFDNYKFVQTDYINNMIDRDLLVYHKKFFDYTYGISRKNWSKSNFVCVTNPVAILQLEKQNLLNDCFIIKLDPPTNIIKERMKERSQLNGVDNYDYNQRLIDNYKDMESINHIKPSVILKNWNIY